jgi:hypothetical protein
MTDDLELKRRMAAAAAIALQETIDACREVAAETERVTGYRVVSPPAGSVLDMPARSFVAQARIYAAVADIVERWEVPGSTRTLWDLLKTNPDASEMARLFRLAGHLPADG